MRKGDRQLFGGTWLEGRREIGWSPEGNALGWGGVGRCDLQPTSPLPE